MALFAKNATTCFDQMVPKISTPVIRKYYMEPSMITISNLAMAGMKHQFAQNMTTPTAPTVTRLEISKWQVKLKA